MRRKPGTYYGNYNEDLLHEMLKTNLLIFIILNNFKTSVKTFSVLNDNTTLNLEICKSILYEDVKSIILIRLRDLSQTSGVILFVVVILIDDLAAFNLRS